jgi:tripartite-type tricarboxylate transporter receptor subunit TctC
VIEESTCASTSRPEAVKTQPARGRIRALGLLLALTTLGTTSASAADWPDKPVRLVVPFAAAGATDLLGRSLANELGKAWKQPVIVDNRPGAGGAVGAEVVSKSPADGYALLLASGSMFTVNPYIYQKLPYTTKSFELITKVASGPMVVTVNADLPVRNLQQLIAYAKANPGKVNFASAGTGSQVHMAGESFADASGIEITHVAYKGEGPAYADLLAGVVQMAVGNINAISPLLKSGRVRALAVTGKERVSLLPDVPTVAEAGLPNYEFTGWFALVAPAGTPKVLTDKMYAAVQQAVTQPGMKRYLAEQGMTPTLSQPGTLDDDIAKEAERWKALVAKRRIAAN